MFLIGVPLMWLYIIIDGIGGIYGFWGGVRRIVVFIIALILFWFFLKSNNKRRWIKFLLMGAGIYRLIETAFFRIKHFAFIKAQVGFWGGVLNIAVILALVIVCLFLEIKHKGRINHKGRWIEILLMGVGIYHLIKLSIIVIKSFG